MLDFHNHAYHANHLRNKLLKRFFFTAPACTGLKSEWISTMETKTQFPVDFGTVVEITCSDTDTVVEGSSEVTCIAETMFTLAQEPSCIIPGG